MMVFTPPWWLPPQHAARFVDLRKSAYKLVREGWFERLVLTIIVVNAITLGFETSPTIMARLGGLLHVLDEIMLWFFVVELAMRMFAYGWRFWRDPWAVFDFLVVAVTLLPQTGNLSVLRAMRILRALRLITAIPSVKRVVTGLLVAIPSMSSIIVLVLLINYVFAVMATKMFGAEFEKNFGTIGASLFTFFQIMTLDGWGSEVVRPVMEKYPYAWAFFLPYIIFVTFAVLNLFIGIVVDAMQQQQEEATETVINVTQAEYHHLVDEIRALRAELKDMRADRNRSPPPR
ncbi:MAG: ion transporter [Hyphomicrobiaceae bacterium]